MIKRTFGMVVFVAVIGVIILVAVGYGKPAVSEKQHDVVVEIPVENDTSGSAGSISRAPVTDYVSVTEKTDSLANK